MLHHFIRRLAAGVACACVGILTSTAAVAGSTTTFDPNERATLIALYLATGGDGWTNNNNWCSGNCPGSGTPTFNTPGTECTWFGVTCDAAQVHVTRIDLLANNLNGGPLPDLTVFSALQALRLYQNHVSGPLPDLHSVTQLTQYVLFDNAFSGPMPANLASWPALQVFQVSDNQLTGALPALSGASQLQDFEAARNQLSGPLPSFAGLAQLQYFDAQSNALSGALPSLAGLAQLNTFLVNDNVLSGGVPSLGGLSNLAAFDVDTNQLSGNVPSLAGLSQLTYASFAGNALSGGFPSLSGATALRYLDLSYNQLGGSLPADLDTAISLRHLYVQNNQFSGALPTAPAALLAHQSELCPNPFTLTAGPNDGAWNAATGQTPWWGPAGGGCDAIAANGLELLTNGSFEGGLTGWHVGSGACIWQTVAAGEFTTGLGQWAASTPVDGSHELVSDTQNYGACTLYQDVHVPSGVSSASFSAAVGYNIAAGGDAGCSVSVALATTAGSVIAPYVELSGPANIPLTQYAPLSIGVQPGAVLRVLVTTNDVCAAVGAGIALDNVNLTLL